MKTLQEYKQEKLRLQIGINQLVEDIEDVTDYADIGTKEYEILVAIHELLEPLYVKESV